MQFLIDIVQKVHDDLFIGDWFVGVKELVVGTLNNVSDYLLPLILAAFGIVVTFAGKKIFPFLKFLFMFSIGFIAAYVYVAPVLAFLGIDAWIVGVIVGALCGLLSRYLYILAVIGGCALVGVAVTDYYIMNLDVIADLLANLGGAGKYVSYALIAGVCMLFVFPLLKWVEMAVTSFFGACGFYFPLVFAFPVVKLSTLIPALPSFKFEVLGQFFLPTTYFLADYILIGLLFIGGLVTQIVTRRKY